MKKTKLLGITTLLLSLGLAGCLGPTTKEKNPNKGEKYETTSEGHYELDENGDRISNTIEAHSWEVAPNGVGSKKPKPATCLMPGVEVKKCTVCGRAEQVPTPALGHEYEDVDDGAVKATCTTPGKIHQKCSRCNDEVDKDSPALGHKMNPVATNKDGVTKSVCERGDVAEIVLDITKTDSGWKDAENKWNAKSGDTAKATWNIPAGIVEDGDYSIEVECKMTSSGHTDRYWFNHAKFGKADEASQPDTTSESDYRYWFQVNNGSNINTDNQKTWSENGMSDTDFTFVKVVSSTTISGLTSFSAYHGNIGYSLIISRIKLVKIA